MSKHPELTTDVLSPGVSYMCAYGRLEHGWSFERAISEPPRPTRPRRTYTERMALYAAKREANAIKRVLIPRQKRGGRVGRVSGHVASMAPVHVQTMLASYCAEFIKTGVLNPEGAAKLKDYADACRSVNKNFERVPTEPAAQGSSGPRRLVGDDRDRDAAQAGA